ncbi:MAG: VWA domain-containing protein [Terracidiphilus sp.]
MSARILFLLFLGTMLPASGSRPLTVEQLAQIVASSRSKSDTDIAWQIGNLRLTERLTMARFSQLRGVLPGEKSRQALQILEDESEFLNPPERETTTLPPPGVPEQRRMMGLVVSYVKNAIPLLPNFFATRDTQRFEDTPQLQRPQGPLIPYEPIHLVGRSRVTVLYREGREVVEAEAARQRSELSGDGLTTRGVFGPILGIVLVDAAKSNLKWSHWERNENQPDQLSAVFKFDVPKEHSEYEINYCCVPHESATTVANLEPYRRMTGYRGTMTVDPASGTILRLVIDADLMPTDPVSKAAILVDFGPVKIGGRSYICPLRSISTTVAQSVQMDPVYKFPLANQLQPLRTAMNEVVFEDYHMFRADARVLTPAEAELVKEAAAAPPPSVASPAAEHRAVEQSITPATTQDRGAEAVSAGPQTASTVSSSTPVPSSNAVEPNSPAPETATPEIDASTANAFPDLPVNTEPIRSNSGFTLRTTSRLVDVSVLAFDKKGHPVTDLKLGEFELYDNGRKQNPSFFSQAGTPSPLTQSNAEPVQAANPSNEPQFSNQHPVETTRNGNAVHDLWSTILLIDAVNLAFGDLTYAREGILRFLKALPTDERVGLYVLKSRSFEVLLEPTALHDQVAAELRAWMPSAQDLARAQDAEQRNRQQFDWVHRVDDLAYVNGNGEGGNDPAMSTHEQIPALPPDAKLRNMGSGPERDALYLLQGIGRHLASIPDHKTLVWVTSDNVLADWSSQAAAKEDQGNKFFDPLAIHAREALNEAHVSIYPLDASQLEAGGVTADIGSRNVLAMGKSDRDAATAVLGDAAPGMKPGRETAKMQQDTHPIQPAFRELAEATGGRTLRRAGDIAAELTRVVEDGRAAYLLSFTPSDPADDKYHLITVKVTDRRYITLRHRTGYLYSKEPTTLKERFRQAIWQPADVSEIAMTASPETDSIGNLLKLNIAGSDLDLAQQGDRWSDKLDIFLVQRSDAEVRAKVTGQTLSLHLKPSTYRKILHEGLAFDERVESRPGGSELRVVVVDENSSRMGSVTVPLSALNVKH